MPVRWVHLAAVGKAAVEGGRATITESLVCCLRSWTAPSDCSFFYLTNSKGVPTVCRAGFEALGILGQKVKLNEDIYSSLSCEVSGRVK